MSDRGSQINEGSPAANPREIASQLDQLYQDSVRLQLFSEEHLANASQASRRSPQDPGAGKRRMRRLARPTTAAASSPIRMTTAAASPTSGRPCTASSFSPPSRSRPKRPQSASPTSPLLSVSLAHSPLEAHPTFSTAMPAAFTTSIGESTIASGFTTSGVTTEEGEGAPEEGTICTLDDQTPDVALRLYNQRERPWRRIPNVKSTAKQEVQDKVDMLRRDGDQMRTFKVELRERIRKAHLEQQRADSHALLRNIVQENTRNAKLFSSLRQEQLEGNHHLQEVRHDLARQRREALDQQYIFRLAQRGIADHDLAGLGENSCLDGYRQSVIWRVLVTLNDSACCFIDICRRHNLKKKAVLVIERRLHPIFLARKQARIRVAQSVLSRICSRLLIQVRIRRKRMMIGRIRTWIMSLQRHHVLASQARFFLRSVHSAQRFVRRFLRCRRAQKDLLVLQYTRSEQECIQRERTKEVEVVKDKVGKEYTRLLKEGTIPCKKTKQERDLARRKLLNWASTRVLVDGVFRNKRSVDDLVRDLQGGGGTTPGTLPSVDRVGNRRGRSGLEEKARQRGNQSSGLITALAHAEAHREDDMSFRALAAELGVFDKINLVKAPLDIKRTVVERMFLKKCQMHFHKCRQYVKAVERMIDDEQMRIAHAALMSTTKTPSQPASGTLAGGRYAQRMKMQGRSDIRRKLKDKIAAELGSLPDFRFFFSQEEMAEVISCGMKEAHGRRERNFKAAVEEDNLKKKRAIEKSLRGAADGDREPRPHSPPSPTEPPPTLPQPPEQTPPIKSHVRKQSTSMSGSDMSLGFLHMGQSPEKSRSKAEALYNHAARAKKSRAGMDEESSAWKGLGSTSTKESMERSIAQEAQSRGKVMRVGELGSKAVRGTRK